jgi:membrane-anchored mycosin MYCP
MAARERSHYVAYVRLRIRGMRLFTEAARMRRIAGAMLGLALVAAAQAPAVAAAGSAARPLGTAAAKPSPKPSAKPSSKPSPKPTAKPSPSVPVPVATLPPPDQQCPADQPGPRITTVPWAQAALGFTSVWPMTEGQGVTVAVVDSGVDYSSQLVGKVTAINLTSAGYQDCADHGTSIAAIIAASDAQASGNPFVGVAPDAKILSVKVNNSDVGDALTLADGIRAAALDKAQVINVSIATNVDYPPLRSAVDFAMAQGSVVVAAGGNDENDTGHGPFYPASYPGVLSVGAVGSDDARASFSDLHSHVAVTAPGLAVSSAVPGGYAQGSLNGTSFATAFVSGVAALVRSRYPGLSQAAVVDRIEETADGAAGPGTGNGLVNPLQAVTAILPAHPVPSPSTSVRLQSVPVSKAPPPDRAAIVTTVQVTAGALGAATFAALGGLIITYGRRRRWRAGTMKFPTADGKVSDDPWS